MGLNTDISKRIWSLFSRRLRKTSKFFWKDFRHQCGALMTLLWQYRMGKKVKGLVMGVEKLVKRRSKQTKCKITNVYIRGSQPGGVLFPRRYLQCLGTFLVVTQCGALWLPLGGDHGCSQTSYNAQNTLQQRAISPTMPVVTRLRKPGLNQGRGSENRSKWQITELFSWKTL